MKKIITYAALSQRENIIKKPGFFQIFGVDIMFDKDYNPYILEMNADPFMYGNFILIIHFYYFFKYYL